VRGRRRTPDRVVGPGEDRHVRRHVDPGVTTQHRDHQRATDVPALDVGEQGVAAGYGGEQRQHRVVVGSLGHRSEAGIAQRRRGQPTGHRCRRDHLHTGGPRAPR